MDISPLYHGLLGIVGLVALSAVGVPIGVSLATAGLLGLYATAGPSMAWVTLKTMPYAIGSSYTLVVVPMFILMGLITSSAGIMTDLYNMLNKWLARFKGSLLLVTTAASAAFGAVSGSTIVNATVFTKIAFPEMIRLGYHPGVGAAAIASAGTLASLIPPSINFVIFAVLTEQSIGKLLLAGLAPGILTTLIYMFGIAVCVKIFKDWAPETTQRYSWSEKIKSLKTVWPVALLSALVIGGIYSGLTPPSAAGGVGAIGAILIIAIQGKLTFAMLWGALKQTVQISAVLYLIVVGGLLFSRFLTVGGVVECAVEMMNSMGMGQAQFLIMVIAIFLVLGMFMDTMSILVITTPLLYPIVDSLGINPIWYAVIIVKLMEIAVVSPPVGLNLFAVLAATDKTVTIGQLYKGVIPFILFDLITIGLLILFPEIATWIPDNMM